MLLAKPICLYTKGKKWRYEDFSYQLRFRTQSFKIHYPLSNINPQTHQKAKNLVPEPGCCLIDSEPIPKPVSLIIMPRLASRHGTSPFIWCAAIICALISIVVIFGGIVVFVGYMVIHPRVPILSVSDAHLDLLKYGFMQLLPLFW